MSKYGLGWIPVRGVGKDELHFVTVESGVSGGGDERRQLERVWPKFATGKYFCRMKQYLNKVRT